MRPRKLHLAVTLLTCIIGIGSITLWTTYRRSTIQQQEEYAVYSTVINENSPHERFKLLVIQDRTGMHGESDEHLINVCQSLTRRMPSLEKETLADFQAKSKRPYPLRPTLELKVPYKLISEKELGEFFGKEYIKWDSFYEKYPQSQGVMELSRVGFNRNRTQALVYRGNQSDGLAGAGGFVLLTKENGLWTIKEWAGWWIS